MSSFTEHSPHRNTPTVTVLDNRDRVVRTIDYYRHPDDLTHTEPRITHHAHDARGFQVHSSDPRLQAAGQVNIAWVNDLAGNPLCTQSVDAGVSIRLADAAGRPMLAVTRIGLAPQGGYSHSQAVTRTWHYENARLPGRLLGISEQVEGQPVTRLERLVYGGNNDVDKALNLVGHPRLHYDTVGLLETLSISLTGGTLASSRRLMADADNPAVVADWQGERISEWDAKLEAHRHLTAHTLDANGRVLTTNDAAGHVQRQAYDVAGRLRATWLTLAGGHEQVILRNLRYSAAGQKLHEEHGNGVLTTYRYAPRTQRLARLRSERPAGHALGAKVLQDLRYDYDPVGNVTRVRNDAEPTRFWRNQKVEPESRYTYDSLYQLVNASGREMANAGRQGQRLPDLASLDNHTYSRYTRSYRYDRAGNLTRIRHSAPASANNFTLDITVSDRSNRAVLSELTQSPAQVEALFTADGLQTTLLPGQPLTWTPRGELLKVTPITRGTGQDDCESYRYDIANQRILKASTRRAATTVQAQRVLYLEGLELRSTRHDATLIEDLQIVTLGVTGSAQVRALHWLRGKPQGMPDDPLRYSHDDLLGSAALEVDGSGALISREEHYPYGGTSVWAARSEVHGRYKFIRHAGKERDATGLYYYGHRYYQPWLGRWLSADPAGTVDGLNLFARVRNNPVSLVDDQGLMLKWAMERLSLAGSGETPSSQNERPVTSSASASQALEVQQARPGTPERAVAHDDVLMSAPLETTPTKNQKRLAARKRKRESDSAEKALVAAQQKLRDDARSEAARQRGQRLQAGPVREFGTPARNTQVFERLLPKLPTNRQSNTQSILAIGQRPGSDGKQEIVFLERGVGKEGFKHITQEHRADFKEIGISPDKKIADLVMSALVHGTVVEMQGKTHGRAGRPIYEVEFENQTRYVAVQLKDDNSVLGANPKNLQWQERFLRSRGPR